MFHRFICVFCLVGLHWNYKLRIILTPQWWLTVCFDFIDLKSVSQRINWFYELWIVTMTVSFFAFYMCNTAKNSYFTDFYMQMRKKAQGIDESEYKIPLDQYANCSETTMQSWILLIFFMSARDVLLNNIPFMWQRWVMAHAIQMTKPCFKYIYSFLRNYKFS